jgi:hypothetical protein
MKKILLSAIAVMSLATTSVAQTLPNYVPTNGLVAWWPFNGNANDESGNGNNGTVNGASLTSDRFGSQNSSYSYSSNILSFINFGNNIGNFSSDFCINLWYTETGSTGYLLNKRNDEICSQSWWVFNPQGFEICLGNGSSYDAVYHNMNFQQNSWHQLLVNRIGNYFYLYVDGNLASTRYTSDYYVFNNQSSIYSGITNAPISGYVAKFTGKIDDIGIWNRALTQQEITNLFNVGICSNDLSITPQNNSLQIGSTAIFTATTSDTNPSYVWQSDFGQGFQTLNNYGNYSGVNTSALSIANVQLPNHTQAVRAISTSGNCVDTSNVAYIHIADTCVNTVNDTNLITVTDTLLINVNTVGLNPNPIQNTIKVFPNPANTHISIDYGNYSSLSGYQLKIENSLGQVVFQTNINQQSNYLDLSNWGGNGIYFVRIIDPQGNTVDIRKIVLQ